MRPPVMLRPLASSEVAGPWLRDRGPTHFFRMTLPWTTDLGIEAEAPALEGGYLVILATRRRAKAKR